MQVLKSVAVALVAALLWQPVAEGQPGGGQGQIGGQLGGQTGGGGQGAGQGGAANADFDALIDLIVSTVAPDTWNENGGGEAEIRPFPTGVWVDPAGVLQTTVEAPADAGPATTSAKPRAARSLAGPTVDADARRDARLRCVSLPRLEAEIARRAAAGEPLDESMLTLAGLRRVERLFLVEPGEGGEPGDLVIAGPAGDWVVETEGRIVAADTGAAVPRLDDLLVLLRREGAAPGSPFGCAITPRQAALAATQQRLDQTSGRPLPPGGRRAWLEGVRSTLGPQDIEVWGLDPSTNAARVLVEADHHMKRLGLGDARRVDGVPSYLDRVADGVRRGEEASPLSVLRWWFATNYGPLERSANGDAFRLTGQGVAVLSENELLTRRGERVHTGQSDPATKGFADDFTTHFAAVCAAYPIYYDLRNVFDLAIVAAVVHGEGLAERAGWTPGLFLDTERLPTPRLRHATQVDTMATSRVVNRTRILAAVSGGVWFDAKALIGDTAEPSDGAAGGYRPAADRPQDGGWWWDAE